MTKAHLAAVLQGVGVGAYIGWGAGFYGAEWTYYPIAILAFVALLSGYALDVAREQDGGGDD